ncbi:MAG: caspase family protein [Cyanobacteria bacterium P01_D01_bin.14]
MKRRELLVKSGLVLSALGLGQSPLVRYQQALAQPTRRKLALLIGINAYPERVSGSASGSAEAALRGSLTDVALQRELLIHRFGFQPADIFTLTDQQATRRGIVEAFDQHLRSQAQPGDVVVLHFSGYGSQLRLGDRPMTSWVPYDGTLPTEAAPTFNELTENTVRQLLKTLKSKTITTVIDAGFTAPERPLTGGFKVRSRPVTPAGEALADLPILTELLGEKPAVPQQYTGLVLQAARPEQLVVERSWDDVSAGLFTYALTQQIWETTAPVRLTTLMGKTREAVQQWAPQLPQVGGQRASEAQQPYEGATPFEPAADAVVTERSSRMATLWLGGLPPEALPYSDQSWFSVLDGESLARPVRSRTGLTTQIDISDLSATENAAWQVGAIAIETLRILPRQIDLVVAIDHSLERIERVDATSALAALPFVSSTATDTQLADCLFGKPPVEPTQTASLGGPPEEPGVKQGYGLFLPTRDLLPGTLAKQDEAIKAAISRLTPKLRTLLAMKRLRSTVNASSSRLAVRLNLEMTSPQEKLLLQKQTLRPALPKSRLAEQIAQQDLPLTVGTGSRLRYRLFNFNQLPLYFVFVSVDARDRMLAFLPPLPAPDTDAPATPLQNRYSVAPGTAISIPEADIDWGIEEPIGSVETLIICSTTPFTQAAEALAPLSSKSNSQRVDLGEAALTIAEAILSDLDYGNPDRKNVSTDSYALNAATWATLALSYDEIA